MSERRTVRGATGKGASIAAFIAACLVFLPHAHAAPCAGFTDVDDASAFCGNVAWIRNRGVTLGCTSSTSYCPNDAVSRLAMAAFMNRLGSALTPRHLPVDVAPGAIDLDATPVVCQTQDFAVSGFARRAYVDASFSATAVADVGLVADLALSDDGGATWTNLNANVTRGFVRANQWGSLGGVGSVDVEVGSNVRFGVRTSRGGAGTVNLADSRCQLRVLLFDRND